MGSPVNIILDVWTGFIKLMEYLDKEINGADSRRFQDCFIKVKLVVFFLGVVWNLRIKTATRGVFVQIKLLIWEKKSNLFNNNLYEGNSQTYRIKETDDPCGNICPKWSLLVQCLKGSVTLELVAQDSVWNQSSLQVSPVIDQGQLQTEFRRNWAR